MDGRTDRRTENIYSIFRNKLLLLGEHVYVESTDTLFHLWDIPIPADVLNQANTCAIFISGREKEENIAGQWHPITREMFAALKNLGDKLASDSLEAVIANWFIFIRFAGLRVAKYVQKTEININVHE
jgi:hypothetical protein